MLYVPFRPPNSPRAKNTAKLCMVKGRADGMVIQAHSAISATQRAMRVKSLIFIKTMCLCSCDPALKETYDRGYSVYRQLYPALKGITL